jgi:hypothetical protein
MLSYQCQLPYFQCFQCDYYCDYYYCDYYYCDYYYCDYYYQ